ncbi:MAG TPA: hypothetical protein VLG27_00030 [Candidatus Saccharimonadia bacterium]|nr:hypothetical protein [Candidatus Saccharimonadia bacterium]
MNQVKIEGVEAWDAPMTLDEFMGRGNLFLFPSPEEIRVMPGTIVEQAHLRRAGFQAGEVARLTEEQKQDAHGKIQISMLQTHLSALGIIERAQTS